MAKSFRELLKRSGYSTRDMSQPRVDFEYDNSDLVANPINGMGSNNKINAVNSGFLPPYKGMSSYSEQIPVSEQNDIAETGIPQPDSRDKFVAELKRYPVTDRELVDANAQKFKKFSPKKLGQEEPTE